jgi:hypothetical protein
MKGKGVQGKNNIKYQRNGVRGWNVVDWIN